MQSHWQKLTGIEDLKAVRNKVWNDGKHGKAGKPIKAQSPASKAWRVVKG